MLSSYPVRQFSPWQQAIIGTFVAEEGGSQMRVVYLDMLFLTSFLIQYLLLRATGTFSGLPFKRKRLALSALAGAVYATVFYLRPPPSGPLLFLHLLFGALFVWLGFGFESARNFRKRLLTFFLLALVFAGGVVGLSLAGAVARIDFKTLLVSILICYGGISLFFSGAARHGGRLGETVPIRIAKGKREVRFQALLDSGNTLKDPISNAPVLIVEPDSVRAILPGASAGILRGENLKNPSAVLEDLRLAGEHRGYRLIPYRALGIEHGLLLGFRPERIWVLEKERKDLLVALSPVELSEGAGYCALIGTLN